MATVKAKRKAKATQKKAQGNNKASKLVAGVFKRETLKVNGVDTVMYVGGSGDPLVFFHGAGTATGIEFAAPWTKKFKVYLPFHPGFGESGDGEFNCIDDYVLHYLDMFDQLKLDKVNLVGLSMGGWIASTFATQNSHRLNKLVLVAPAGLKVEKHPNQDIFKLKPEEFPLYLAHNLDTFLKFLPAPDTPAFFDFIVGNYRETTSWARLAWERAYDLNLPKWLHRISVPTLLLYGDKDRIVPWQQSKEWAKLIPDAKVQIIKNAGHIVLDEKPEAVTKIMDFLSK